VFPLGTTTVTWAATDEAGNTATATQTVTVVDREPPSITAPAAITQNTDPGKATATIDPGTATATDNAGTATVTGTRSDGKALRDPYPVGTTTLTWTATDPSGNTATATQTVTVRDGEPPTITAPADQAVEATSSAGATDASAFMASATDNVTVSPSIVYAVGGRPITRGYVFSLGETVVTVTATDEAGNSSSATFRVMVRDTTAPVITATVTPSTLWPPNGKAVTVQVSGRITDLGSGVDPASATFTTVDSYGQVQPHGTFGVDSNGNFSFSLQLEARRNGQDKAGRTYSITIRVKDKAGNLGTLTLSVLVPHDQGNG
jgi:VCBS repeat-containing protein